MKIFKRILISIVLLFLLSQLVSLTAYAFLSPLDKCVVRTQIQWGNRPWERLYEIEEPLIEKICSVELDAGLIK